MTSNGSRSFRIISINEMKKVPNKLEEKNEKAHVPSQPAFIYYFSWDNISILFHGNMNSSSFFSLQFTVKPKVIGTFF